jgi:hypothetical protein
MNKLRCCLQPVPAAYQRLWVVVFMRRNLGNVQCTTEIWNPVDVEAKPVAPDSGNLVGDRWAGVGCYRDAAGALRLL